jgi:ubiquitin carboxyl-terminal hydrolase 36/42
VLGQVPCVQVHPLRKATKAGSKKGANAAAAAKGNINSNGDCLMDVIIDGEFRQRVDESGTVLATDKQLDKNSGSSSSLLSNQWEAGRSDGPKDSKREVMQNGLMSMLTRGLEETVGK